MIEPEIDIRLIHMNLILFIHRPSAVDFFLDRIL